RGFAAVAIDPFAEGLTPLAAAARGHWEAAYHALGAASHLAEDLRDAARLREVEAEARGQRAAVDARAAPPRGPSSPGGLGSTPPADPLPRPPPGPGGVAAIPHSHRGFRSPR